MRGKRPHCYGNKVKDISKKERTFVIFTAVFCKKIDVFHHHFAYTETRRLPMQNNFRLKICHQCLCIIMLINLLSFFMVAVSYTKN